MEDLCLSIGAKISEYLVEPLLFRPLCPIFCFKRFVDDFESEHNKLIREHYEKVKNDVKVAKDNAYEIYENVNKWLEEVNAVMEEALILQEKLKKHKSCFSIGWTCHYRLSKKTYEVTDTIKKLIEAESFHDNVGRPIDLHQHIELSSSEESMVLNNAASALQEIMEALTNEDVNKVGLYGTGAGKTILAKKVCKEAKRRGMFERTILVDVPPDNTADAVMSMQGIIADHVNLSIKHLASKEGIATLLRNRLLRNGEKILIILDKVQKEFDLDTVGIPSSGCCKVLLTTHDLRICNCMRTHRNIQLGALYEVEGTEPFKIVVGFFDQVAMVDAANTNYVHAFLSIYLLLVFQPIVAWVLVFIILLFIIRFYYSAIKKKC